MQRLRQARHRLLKLAGAAGALVLVLVAVLQADATAPATSSFERTWARTDKPVADGRVSRTWMWGPSAFTAALSEPYIEGPDHQRTVQYFDKARMEETTDPNADPNSIWSV